MRFLVMLGVLVLTLLTVWFLPGWQTVGEDEERVLLGDGRNFSKAEFENLLPMFLEQGASGARLTDDGNISVAEKYRTRCDEIVRNNDPSERSRIHRKDAGGFGDFILPSAEKENRRKEQKITLLEQILQRNSGIREAIIVHDQAKGATFQRKEVHTALVTLWATEGNVIENLQATTARQVVVNAFAGMQEEDVTVVDGDTGMSFHPRDNSRMDQLIAKNQLDLETARQQYTNQFRRLLYEFGSCEIDVRMNLEKRSHVVQRVPQRGGADEKVDLPQVEVVANGKGKIRPKGPPAAGIEKPAPEFATVLIRRLIGIEVTLQQGDVEDYLKKQMGLKTGTSEEQYSRGVVNIRNEITKKIVSWIRSQGIEVGPDIVSVTVLSATAETREPAAETESAYTAVQASLIVGGLLLLVMVGVLVTAGFKSRSPVIHSSTQQFSGAGREFVNRNQATTGSLLVDEVNEVVQSAPGTSAQAFQNLVTGEGNR